MHSNVTSKNVSWPHFSWTTLYVFSVVWVRIDLLLQGFQVKVSRLVGQNSHSNLCYFYVLSSAFFMFSSLVLFRVAQKKVPNICMHYSPEQSK